MATIAALCPTYRRPQLLGQLIKLFQMQTCMDSELIILDDAGQYGNVAGDRWRIISMSDRFPSVEAKRNYLIRNTSAEMIAMWDDDDIYLPWALDACAYALSNSTFAQPRQILEWTGPGEHRWKRCLTYGHRHDYCYGGCWSYRRDWFLSTGGYPEHEDNGGDWYWFRRIAHSPASVDTICDRYPDPFYVYNRGHFQSWSAGNIGYNSVPDASIDHAGKVDVLDIKLLVDVLAIPMPINVEPRPW